MRPVTRSIQTALAIQKSLDCRAILGLILRQINQNGKHDHPLLPDLQKMYERFSQQFNHIGLSGGRPSTMLAEFIHENLMPLHEDETPDHWMAIADLCLNKPSSPLYPEHHTAELRFIIAKRDLLAEDIILTVLSTNEHPDDCMMVFKFNLTINEGSIQDICIDARAIHPSLRKLGIMSEISDHILEKMLPHLSEKATVRSTVAHIGTLKYYLTNSENDQKLQSTGLSMIDPKRNGKFREYEELSINKPAKVLIHGRLQKKQSKQHHRTAPNSPFTLFTGTHQPHPETKRKPETSPKKTP